MDGWEQRDGFRARQPERRSDPRYSVDEDSVVIFLGYGAPQQARLVDLSQEGCRLRLKERVNVCARLSVEIFFRINGVSLRFPGVVQWTNSSNVLGVRFVNIVPRRMVELATVICEMEESAEARGDAVNLLVAEQEAPNVAARNAMGRVEDGSREPVAVAGMELPGTEPPGVPAALAQTATQTARTPTRRERRQKTRHDVDTLATIFLVKIGSTLRGRIVDLSLSGCRIRTDDRFPVGICTRVETEFRLEGLPFRLGGVIQAIHDRNTVGIRFLDLSERKREQVLELIGEIEQLRAAQPAATEGSI